MLAALEPQMIVVKQAIEQLKEAGHSFETVSEISEELRTGLVGTMMARGAIVDKLVERGVMRPEASRYGATAILQASQAVLEEYKRKKKDIAGLT